MKHYTQLTHEQRYQIHACMKAGWDQTEIATEIGTHKSTVSRELRRNRGARGYRPKQAHAVAMARRAAKVSTKLSPRDWTRVERLLRLDCMQPKQPKEQPKGSDPLLSHKQK
ncbi:MAG TPA: helix-turn-helix domain-containing protein [Acidiferrobacterales bacterium]|jgi:IS30 family transposase